MAAGFVTLRKTTLVDWPGRVASAIFLPGCNLRCPWCQNGALVLNRPGENAVTLDEALAHVHKRRAVLGGVAISGGEPTIYAGLADLIAEIHRAGLPVKLDTNGTRPDVLAALFSAPKTRPDYVALDLKTAPERYEKLLPRNDTSSSGGEAEPGGKNAELTARFAGFPAQSAQLTAESGIEHEFRSLALPENHFTGADVEALAPLVDGRSPWHFRRFVPGACLDPAWNVLPPAAREDAERLAARARALGKNASAP